MKRTIPIVYHVILNRSDPVYYCTWSLWQKKQYLSFIIFFSQVISAVSYRYKLCKQNLFYLITNNAFLYAILSWGKRKPEAKTVEHR
jgi:hypothetical protein